jgi:hypothetical protein
VRADLRLEAWLTLGVGAVFTAVAAGSLELAAACVADPACLPQRGQFDLGGIFAPFVAGAGLIVAALGGVLLSRPHADCDEGSGAVPT